MAKARKQVSVNDENEKIPVFRSSGNVFADIGLENAEELQRKTDLMFEIYERLRSLKITQAQAARRLGIGQPDVSKLMNGRFTRFSVNRLMELLAALAVDIDITLRPRRLSSPKRGIIRVLTPGKNARA
jgi:predicted XRE-type DNA-binding protein